MDLESLLSLLQHTLKTETSRPVKQNEETLGLLLSLPTRRLVERYNLHKQVMVAIICLRPQSSEQENMQLKYLKEQFERIENFGEKFTVLNQMYRRRICNLKGMQNLLPKLWDSAIDNDQDIILLSRSLSSTMNSNREFSAAELQKICLGLLTKPVHVLQMLLKLALQQCSYLDKISFFINEKLYVLAQLTIERNMISDNEDTNTTLNNFGGFKQGSKSTVLACCFHSAIINAVNDCIRNVSATSVNQSLSMNFFFVTQSSEIKKLIVAGWNLSQQLLHQHDPCTGTWSSQSHTLKNVVVVEEAPSYFPFGHFLEAYTVPALLQFGEDMRCNQLLSLKRISIVHIFLSLISFWYGDHIQVQNDGKEKMSQLKFCHFFELDQILDHFTAVVLLLDSYSEQQVKTMNMLLEEQQLDPFFVNIQSTLRCIVSYLMNTFSQQQLKFKTEQFHSFQDNLVRLVNVDDENCLIKMKGVQILVRNLVHPIMKVMQQAGLVLISHYLDLKQQKLHPTEVLRFAMLSTHHVDCLYDYYEQHYQTNSCSKRSSRASILLDQVSRYFGHVKNLTIGICIILVQTSQYASIHSLQILYHNVVPKILQESEDSKITLQPGVFKICTVTAIKSTKYFLTPSTAPTQIDEAKNTLILVHILFRVLGALILSYNSKFNIDKKSTKQAAAIITRLDFLLKMLHKVTQKFTTNDSVKEGTQQLDISDVLHSQCYVLSLDLLYVSISEVDRTSLKSFSDTIAIFTTSLANKLLIGQCWKSMKECVSLWNDVNMRIICPHCIRTKVHDIFSNSSIFNLNLQVRTCMLNMKKVFDNTITDR